MIFSPCIDIIFSHHDLSFSEKVRKVHKLGYSAYEFWSWTDLDLNEVENVQNELGIKAATFIANASPLIHPNYRSHYEEEVIRSIAVAQRLGTKNLLTLTGWQTYDEIPRESQYQSIVEGLKRVAPHLEQSGITIVLESLNEFDHPGYFLRSSQEAFSIIDEVGSPNIKVLFDIYHQQISEGNLTPNIINNLDKIGYFHIADHPGRNEPGTGEINYHNILRAIEQAGYTGFLGLEYKPEMDPELSLQTFKENYILISKSSSR
ncbi:hydroxypyruvate isomerase family protein [Paenibacillus montanisoli]|uniref:hydroxypyruvate isomerase family protein n=1 Tax=Paenibacillus montanisoli TaxID=2081970 RepID=UPI001402FD0B|nr:TIM barrel protein [Paenibacillus montanisoli]